MSELSSEYIALRNACEIISITTELEAYERLLMVKDPNANSAKAVLRNFLADNTGLGDEVVQVACEEQVARNGSL